jgi:undecaprenyl diphosphate synthase
MIKSKKMNNPHIGIILDGNRRWALEKGFKAYHGHKKGLETAKNIIEQAYQRGVGMLTLFVFSTENWKRPQAEVDFLMGLIEGFYNKEFKKSKKGELFDKVKVRMIGQREKFSKKINQIIDKIEQTTEKNKGMILNIALSYGGRAEIVEIIKKAVKESLPEKDIDEDYVKKNLSIPDMDLIIRTGKEKRLSNFFIWQSAYSELYFLDKYWPEFTEDDFDQALDYYQSRQRRFGK